MKKITLSLFALTFGLFLNAQEVTLSHSVDPETITEGGVACWASDSGEYRDNFFARAYNLADFDVEGDFQINAIEFGVGSADDGVSVIVSLYTADSEDLSSATLNLLYEGLQPLSSGDDLTLVTAEVDALAPAGSIVVVEIMGIDTGEPFQRYFPGFNTAGETAPSWLKAEACSINEYTIASTVAPGQEYVMNLVGEEILSVNDQLLSEVLIYPNPASDVINISVPGSVEISNARLFDILGKNTGVTISNGTMNIGALAKGVYMLSLETTAGTLTKKIVKR